MQDFHAGRRKHGIGGADGKHGFYEYMETQAIYLQTVSQPLPGKEVLPE